jgi:ketosteroid isomerase-like protein
VLVQPKPLPCPAILRAMPEEKVETIRRVHARWAEGDFREDGLFDPLIVFVIGTGFPEAGAYLGPGRVREYMQGFLEPWERITIRAEEIMPAGDSVVVGVHQQGVGRESGAATELDYTIVWTFRGEKVIRFETFRERATALEAAGLAKASEHPSVGQRR